MRGLGNGTGLLACFWEAGFHIIAEIICVVFHVGGGFFQRGVGLRGLVLAVLIELTPQRGCHLQRLLRCNGIHILLTP